MRNWKPDKMTINNDEGNRKESKNEDKQNSNEPKTDIELDYNGNNISPPGPAPPAQVVITIDPPADAPVEGNPSLMRTYPTNSELRNLLKAIRNRLTMLSVRALALEISLQRQVDSQILAINNMVNVFYDSDEDD